MFSQFRNAVEHLAQQPLRSISQDSSTSPLHERASSTDSILSSEQLASPALTNLRKSLASQRSASPKTTAASPDPSKPRSKLEERLRASLSFTIGDASNSTTPGASNGVTPEPSTGDTSSQDVLAPESIPLPDSPIGSPLIETTATAHPLQGVDPTTPDVQPLAQPKPVRADPEISTAETLEAVADDQEGRHVGSDIPLPTSPIVEEDEPSTPDVTVEIPDPDASGGDVEILKQQLKKFKERFADISSSFKRLQAEKLAADKVLQEFTPLQSMNDGAGLREYIENISLQAEMSQDEIKRLTNKLLRQDERIEELRDTHRLESKSQSEQIDKLKKQMEETDALLKAAQTSEINKKGESQKTNAEIERMKAETEKLKVTVTQEEEKRSKAIVLLKTVRQKLVKAEKERDDCAKEANDLKEKDKAERVKERTERSKLQQEIDQVNLEREKAVAGLKAQFDREVANLKDRHDKELSALKGQFELEAITRKSAHSKELETRNQHIHVLESSVQTLTREKDNIFDQLQMRQAELESSQGHMESLQSQATEFQYQIRELTDRNALLVEELAETQAEHQRPDKGPEMSAEEVARLLSAAETKYESRLADLRKQLDAVEKERNDADSDWSTKFSKKAKEVEDLKKSIASGAKSQVNNEQLVLQLRDEVDRLREEVRSQHKHALDLQRQADKVKDVEDTAQIRMGELSNKISGLEKQLEEAEGRETQFRASNKTLREELRKVQSSAALLERQRNPGLGYWASRENVADSRTSISSNSDRPSQVISPTPSQQNNDEEVNLEYLRNVVLQFLEHKDMRPNLVRILTTILRFTPQETRRLSRSL